MHPLAGTTCPLPPSYVCRASRGRSICTDVPEGPAKTCWLELRLRMPPSPTPHLLIDIADGLLALAVHVQDLQERLVHALITGEAVLWAAIGRTRLQAWASQPNEPSMVPHQHTAAPIPPSTHLDLVDIVDGLVELDGLLGLQGMAQGLNARLRASVPLGRFWPAALVQGTTGHLARWPRQARTSISASSSSSWRASSIS
jgi:hypothetical protein